MGNWFLKDKSKTTAKNVLVAGLDGAGKTTFLYNCHNIFRVNEELITKYQTFVQVEKSNIKTANLVFSTEYAGGRGRFRYVLLNHVLPTVDGIIWIVDSNDRERMEEMLEEMDRFLFQKQLSKDEYLHKPVPILFLANKQDLPNAIRIGEMNNMLLQYFGNKNTSHSKSDSVKRSIQWMITPCCATSGDGIAEAIQNLHELMTKNKLNGSDVQ